MSEFEWCDETALTREDMEIAYVEGYLAGYGVEHPSRINYRTAVSQFDRWWRRNYNNG